MLCKKQKKPHFVFCFPDQKQRYKATPLPPTGSRQKATNRQVCNVVNGENLRMDLLLKALLEAGQVTASGNTTLTHVILILGHRSYCILMCYKFHICLSCSSSICSNINVNSYRVQWWEKLRKKQKPNCVNVEFKARYFLSFPWLVVHCINSMSSYHIHLTTDFSSIT